MSIRRAHRYVVGAEPTCAAQLSPTLAYVTALGDALEIDRAQVCVCVCVLPIAQCSASAGDKRHCAE